MLAEHHILVVDDDPAIRDAMALVLETEGYTVKGAANGQEALDHMRGDGPPCLIFLDLMMPVMDGWQFRQEQRRDPALASVPVVVVSAADDAREKAVAMGAVGFLQKPMTFSSLLPLVHQHC